LFGTGQYPKTILSGYCARVSFDPIQRTEAYDTDREKTEIKESADHQDHLPRQGADRGSFP
jgi:hypothetical protein